MSVRWPRRVLWTGEQRQLWGLFCEKGRFNSPRCRRSWTEEDCSEEQPECPMAPAFGVRTEAEQVNPSLPDSKTTPGGGSAECFRRLKVTGEQNLARREMKVGFPISDPKLLSSRCPWRRRLTWPPKRQRSLVSRSYERTSPYSVPLPERNWSVKIGSPSSHSPFPFRSS